MISRPSGEQGAAGPEKRFPPIDPPDRRAARSGRTGPPADAPAVTERFPAPPTGGCQNAASTS